VQASAQPNPEGTPSKQEAEELLAQLRNAPDIPIQIARADGTPVTFRYVKVRGVQRASLPEANSAPINDFAMSFRLAINNDAEEQLTGIDIQFEGEDGRNSFQIHRRRLTVAPHDILRIDADLMTVSGDPATLTVRIDDAKFARGDDWTNPDQPSKLMPAEFPAKPDVDVRPRPIAYASPRYGYGPLADRGRRRRLGSGYSGGERPARRPD
jgi:hypothetical protein